MTWGWTRERETRRDATRRDDLEQDAPMAVDAQIVSRVRRATDE